MSHQKFILTISVFVAFTLKTFCQSENGTDSSTIGKYKYKVCAEIERDTFIVKRISIVSGLDYIDYELKKQIHKVDYYELILENKGGEERLVVSLPSRKHRNRIREGESYYFELYPQFKKTLAVFVSYCELHCSHRKTPNHGWKSQPIHQRIFIIKP